MEIENRYFVLKRKDILKFLTIEEAEILFMLGRKLNVNRRREGRPVLECLCIQKGWPEYEPTLKLLSDRVDGQGIRVMWGSYDEKGVWQYNPALQISEAEQRAHNTANGFPLVLTGKQADQLHDAGSPAVELASRKPSGYLD